MAHTGERGWSHELKQDAKRLTTASGASGGHSTLGSAVHGGEADAILRRGAHESADEAAERRDYLVDGLCTERRAQRHKTVCVTGDSY